MQVSNRHGSNSGYDVVEMDDAARRRLVRACEAGVRGPDLERRFRGHSAASLYKMARRAGWDGYRRSGRTCPGMAEVGAVAPAWALGAIEHGW